ncbi:type II secretion system protein [candidate division TA06 bacterium]|uniref:Type II secretion system protein n=1 Tax=candidate division TA06 bacterium TaxID=2250710 RepID=A0A933IAB1_UNCT6|nr:type II secretion system protein [candidate division TA06 bacterium]
MKEKGFTLIELMVVIIVMGIMMAIAIPNLTRNLPYRNLINGRDQVRIDLSAVRQRAITQDSAYGLYSPAGSLNQYSLFLDRNKDGTFTGGEPALKTMKLPNGITFTQGWNLSFLSSGQLPGGMGAVTVTLTNTKGMRDSILVMLSGAVFH